MSRLKLCCIITLFVFLWHDGAMARPAFGFALRPMPLAEQKTKPAWLISRITKRAAPAGRWDKNQVAEMVTRGVTYEEAVEWRKLIVDQGAKAPYGFWSTPVTAKNMIFAAVDTIVDKDNPKITFKKAREENDLATIEDLYYEYVINHSPKNAGKYKDNGQWGFFQEVGGLGGLLNNPHDYTTDRSVNALLQLALPSLANQMKEWEETRRRLAALLTKPTDFDWWTNRKDIPTLKGRALGVTSNGGKIFIRIESTGEYLPIRVTNGQDGLRLRVADCRPVNHRLYSVDLELKRKNAPVFRRSLQLGGYTNERGSKGTMLLTMSDALGLLPLGEFVLKSSRFFRQAQEEDLPNLEDYCIGETDAGGGITFSPLPSFTYRWFIFGHQNREDREGWRGTIVGSGLREGYFRFLVKWTKEDRDPIWRLYQIGPYPRMMFGTGKMLGRTKSALRIMPAKKFLRKAQGEEWLKRKGYIDTESPERVRARDPILSAGEQASNKEMSEIVQKTLEEMASRERTIAAYLIRGEMIDDMALPFMVTPAEVMAVKRKLQDALRGFVDSDAEKAIEGTRQIEAQI